MTNKQNRIGIYCPGNGTGGPWRYVHSILAGIDLNEFDVTVFSDLGEYEPRPQVHMVRLTGASATIANSIPSSNAVKPQSQKSKLRRFVPRAVSLWSGFGRQALSLARVFRDSQLDLLHTNNTGCEESPVAARLAGIPYVVGTFHVDSTYDLNHIRSGARFRLLEVISNRCLDRAIAVSEATKRDWVRRTHVSPKRVTTIYNGIDTDKFQRRSSRLAARKQLELPVDTRPIIGGLGRLDEAKGFKYLIEAVARLALTHPNLLLVIAGEGPLRADLERQVVESGVGDCVRLLGFQRNVQTVLDAIDIFALPSLCEALPYALLEAMATGLPCVGAAVGGVPEVIVPDETGFVVRARSPAALETALRSLLGSPDLRARTGASGRRRVVEYFREQEMVQKTIELYRTLLRRIESLRPASPAC